MFSPDDTLDCWWLRGEMTCSAKPDIVYQTRVNRTFTISILNVSSAHTGQYACQVANYDPKLIQTCQLQIKFGKRLISEIFLKFAYKVTGFYFYDF